MRRAALVVVTMLVAGLAGCAAAPPPPVVSPPVGQAEFQFLGDWAGVLDGAGEGISAMTVATAATDGTSFDGDLTFTAGGMPSTEPVHAALTPHGHLVAAIGDDASVEAHVVDPTTLDYCFVRYGTDPVYSCGRLSRVG